MANKLNYTEWMKLVNQIIAGRLGGLTADDLPDTATHQMWADGLQPLVAAKLIIRNAKEY